MYRISRRLLIAFWLMSIVGCGQKPEFRQLQFQLAFNGQPVDCMSALDVDGTNWQINALLFYVYDVSFGDAPLTMHASSVQDQSVAVSAPTREVSLVGSRCDEDPRWSVDVSVPALKISEETSNSVKDTLHFTLGVPFPLNHQNPLLAKGDLADSDMFWTWQLGYKFLRFDTSAQDQKQHWALHFGSLGCDSASAVRSPTQPCQYPNQVPVSLENFDWSAPIYVHLDRLFDSATVAHGSCMGDPNDRACAQVFAALGKVDKQRPLFSQKLTEDI